MSDWTSIVETEGETEAERLRREAAANLELAKRSQAELINAQARMRRDAELTQKYAVESFAREILPALDAVLRSIEAVQKAGAPPAVVEALRMIDKEFQKALAKGGIRPIETEGRRFDPLLHEAVAMVDAPDRESQSIVAEARRGYLIHDRVLRPAQVTVARKPG